MTQERARLLELADRVEAATAEQQREMLIEAAEAVCRATLSPDAPSPAWLERWDDLIDAGGWLDAAMTLVPARCWLSSLMVRRNRDAVALITGPGGLLEGGQSNAIALAITAACLRALANKDDSK